MVKNWAHGSYEKRKRDMKFRRWNNTHSDRWIIRTAIITAMFSYPSKTVTPEMRALIDAALAARRERERGAA